MQVFKESLPARANTYIVIFVSTRHAETCHIEGFLLRYNRVGGVL